jgi:hypothetical protein
MIQDYLLFARDMVFLILPILFITFMVVTLLAIAVGFIGWLVERSKE